MAIDGGSSGQGEFQTINVPPQPAPGTTVQPPPPPMQANVTSGHKAGFWIRVGAYLIDGILLAIVGGILGRIFGSGVGGGLNLLIGVVYFVYFWTNGGQTIGFKATNLHIVKTDGSPMTISDGIIRYIGLIISFVVIGLGVMWVGWDANKQGWHDKMAHTYVVRG